MGPMITWTSPARRWEDSALTAAPLEEVNENELLQDSMEKIEDERKRKVGQKFELKSEAILTKIEAIYDKILGFPLENI